jgi:hypothetical protein
MDHHQQQSSLVYDFNLLIQALHHTNNNNNNNNNNNKRTVDEWWWAAERAAMARSGCANRVDVARTRADCDGRRRTSALRRAPTAAAAVRDSARRADRLHRHDPTIV